MPRYTGSAGNDTIKGSSSEDSITGGAGDDVITGDTALGPLVGDFQAGLGAWTISGSGGTYDPAYNGAGDRVLYLDDDGFENSASANVVGPTWNSDLNYSVTLDATLQFQNGASGPTATLDGAANFRVEIVVDGVVVASARQTTSSVANQLLPYRLDLTATGNTPINPSGPMQVRIVEMKPQGVITNNLNFDNVSLTVTDPNAAGTMNDTIDGGDGTIASMECRAMTAFGAAPAAIPFMAASAMTLSTAEPVPTI